MPIGCGPQSWLSPVERGEVTGVRHIRRAHPGDRDRLLEVWLNAVRATHHFLTESDVQSLLPIVRDHALPNLELWVLCEPDEVPIGFIGLDGSSLEALFIDPSHVREGAGRCLTEHARHRKGPLIVSVNEQNSEALKFYIACGFEIVGRSPTDEGGRPFPLLLLRDTA
jgi:putative acetyltransferase